MFFVVQFAGAGIAPASRGYEPREILLLYPARVLYCDCRFFARTIFLPKMSFFYIMNAISYAGVAQWQSEGLISPRPQVRSLPSAKIEFHVLPPVKLI